MSAISDKIKAAQDLAEITEPVPEWGVTLLLISPTSIERAKMIESYTEDVVIEGEIERVVRKGAMMPALLVACAHDPETRERAFPEGAEEWVALKNGAIVERLGMKCMPLVGFVAKTDDTATDTGKDDSSTTQVGDTPSA